MNPLILSTLLLGIGLGTTLAFASSHWLLAWMGLEMNTLAIIPLMAQHHHPRAVEAATKYFLVQAAGAAMLLFATTANAWMMGQWDLTQMAHPLPANLVIMALALKMGLAPLHTWLPDVLQGLDLTTGLILSTWQKLAPLALLLQTHPVNTTLLILLGLTSMLVGGWGGLNQTQLRKVLAYSSIAHLGWMILVLPFMPSLTTLALLTYILMTSSVFLLFKLTKSTSINSLATTWSKAPALTSMTPIILLSLGGLPPLTGFMPKWLILQEIAKQDLAPTAVLAALTALLSLFFYLRVAYAMTLTISPNNVAAISPWRMASNMPTLPTATFMMASIALLPITPAVLALVNT
nr:NADH dehydrogenase subunit 2 [Scorpaena grandicornis]